MKAHILFVILLACMLNACADEQLLAKFSDPAGDDNGAGSMRYPQRADFQVGDLDLLQLRIRRDEEGFWFLATFKNKIRDPKDAAGSVGPETLANFAHKGFYQFNVDIYVDTDRVNGSGNTFTLPGRRVSIDRLFAWEKAVILTPRPELMREQLLSALTEQYPARTSSEITASVDQSVIFPTRIIVHGKSIEFFVPANFFAGSDGTDWGITAFVTGALISIPLDLSLTNSNKKPLDKLQLGVMQPQPGLPRDSFGYSGVEPGPVVDVLAVEAELQKSALSSHGTLPGVAWGAHATEGSAAIATTTGATENPNLAIGDLLKPETVAADAQVEVQPVQPAEQSVVKRLQILQQLFDQKLIDEAEYARQKQRILKEL